MKLTPQQRGTRTYAIILSIAASVGLASVLLALLFKPSSDTNDTAPREDVSVVQRQYQQELNDSSSRFDPVFDMIVREDGRAYLRTDREPQLGRCDIRCGTMTKVGGTIAVSLPVGYIHGSNVVPEPTVWEPVDSLTFWNPIAHRVETKIDGMGVVLPGALKDFRQASDLKPGETAYTSADFVREDDNGKIYLFDGRLAYEMLGNEYGYTLDTPVTRREDGILEAKLPKGVHPLRVGGTMIPELSVPIVVARR